MKRKEIDNFKGGMIDKVNPQRIPDNACVEIVNYEYRKNPILRKRYSADLHDLNDAGIDPVFNFDVWYSGRTLEGNADDKIFVIHTIGDGHGGDGDTTPYLYVVPTDITFDTLLTGETDTDTYRVVGGNLTENVTLTSDNSVFTVLDPDDSTYKSTFTLSISGGAIDTTLTVKFEPDTAQEESGIVSHTSTGCSADLTLSADAVALPQQDYLFWALPSENIDLITWDEFWWLSTNNYLMTPYEDPEDPFDTYYRDWYAWNSDLLDVDGYNMMDENTLTPTVRFEHTTPGDIETESRMTGSTVYTDFSENEDGTMPPIIDGSVSGNDGITLLAVFNVQTLNTISANTKRNLGCLDVFHYVSSQNRSWQKVIFRLNDTGESTHNQLQFALEKWVINPAYQYHAPYMLDSESVWNITLPVSLRTISDSWVILVMRFIPKKTGVYEDTFDYTLGYGDTIISDSISANGTRNLEDTTGFIDADTTIGAEYDLTINNWAGHPPNDPCLGVENINSLEGNMSDNNLWLKKLTAAEIKQVFAYYKWKYPNIFTYDPDMIG